MEEEVAGSRPVNHPRKPDNHLVWLAGFLVDGARIRACSLVPLAALPLKSLRDTVACSLVPLAALPLKSLRDTVACSLVPLAALPLALLCNVP